jgi:acyl CoA:acetate/3-ketoacid CoA transferase beta subunit
MATMVARDIRPGSYINLGIGQPTWSPITFRRRAESSYTPRTACSAWVPQRW